MSPLSNHERRLHVAMAGRGNPYQVLTPRRLEILYRLFQGDQGADLAGAVGLEPSRLDEELAPLLDRHLAVSTPDGSRPNFFISTAGETARVDQHAREVGHRLAERLLERWAEVVNAFGSLALAKTYTLHELSFLLVGDRLLDVGLLDALARDATLMPPAPDRGSEGDPGARYYLWMIEGEYGQLGRYGQRQTPLPWARWSLFTFGDYSAAGGLNAPRDRLEAEVKWLASAERTGTPREVAERTGLPLIGAEDAQRWHALERLICDDLVCVYKDHAPGLRDLYASLGSSRYLPEGFGEFFCWYDHVAYAHAIDALVAGGAVGFPSERFQAMLWQDSDSASAF